MESHARVRQAVNFEPVDRIPVDLPTFAPGVTKYMAELGLSSKEEVADFFGADTIRIEPDYTGPDPNPNWGRKYERIELEDGDIWQQTEEGFPFRNLSIDEIKAFPSPPAPSPDWYDYAGYTAKCEPHAHKAVFTSTSHIIMRHAWSLVGTVDEAMMMLALEPAKMHATLDRVNEFHLTFLERLLSQNPDYPQYVFFNDDVAGQDGPMISPKMYDEFVLPRLKAVSDIVHKHGRKMVMHCCGSIRRLLPHFIKGGVDILHPIQPNTPGNDVYEIRDEFGQDIVLFLGLDMQELMRSGTPGEIKDYYAKLSDDFKDGGLIFNVFPMPDIPLENMLAFREAIVDGK